MPSLLRLSPLSHTWLVDFDGTLVRHNGYKTGKDTFLPGALEFLRSIPRDDMLILLTAREKSAREATLSFLSEHGIRFDQIIFEVPMGERILINDTKPSGLVTAYALTPARDEGLSVPLFDINKNL